VFKRDGDKVRVFLASEMTKEMADPGQDPRDAPGMATLGRSSITAWRTRQQVPSFYLGLAVVRYAPDGIARVVGDEEGARVVHCDANRAPVRRAAAIILEKARQHIDWGADRPAFLEW
jgi:hypothetical protein